MNTDDDSQLLDLLGAFTELNLEPYEGRYGDVHSEDETLVCRGGDKDLKDRIYNGLMSRKKRTKMLQNVDQFKELVHKRNEDESLRLLAMMINDVTTETQKQIFIKAIATEQICNPTQSHQTNSRNPEYIPWNTTDEDFWSTHIMSNDQLHARSGVPQMTNDPLESINLNSINEIDESQRMPEKLSGQLYLIHKGIKYIRLLLSKCFLTKDKSIICELKSRNIFHFVLNEIVQNEKNYIMNLADNYPSSYSEIDFIMSEDRDAILKSSIFVNLAQRSISLLYQLLAQLVTDGIDKNELSKFCDESMFNGVKVCHVLRMNNPNDDGALKKKVEKFLKRHIRN